MTNGDGFGELVGLELAEAWEGRSVVEILAGERDLNPGGTVRGGAASDPIDAATAQTPNPMTDEGERPLTVEIQAYLEPGRPGTLACSSSVRKGGERVTTVEAEVTERESDGVVALAAGTCAQVG